MKFLNTIAIRFNFYFMPFDSLIYFILLFFLILLQILNFLIYPVLKRRELKTTVSRISSFSLHLTEKNSSISTQQFADPTSTRVFAFCVVCTKNHCPVRTNNIDIIFVLISLVDVLFLHSRYNYYNKIHF